MKRPRAFGLPVVALGLALAVAPARRKLVEWLTRVNGTWVGIPEMPERPMVDESQEQS